jgi:hypothetical protein
MTEQRRALYSHRYPVTSLSGLPVLKGIAPEVKRDIRTLQRVESDGMRGDRDALEEKMRLPR